MKGNISKVRGVLGATGPKGDPSYPDWNQNDPTESDYIKNKPDLSLMEDKLNKIRSIDALSNDEQYLSAAGALALAITTEDNAKAHADGLYGELNERVEANEELIESNVGRIIYLENRVGNKEDKANKIQSVNVMTGNEEEYLSANAVLDFVLTESRTISQNANDYTDAKVGGVEEMVTTNEKSIAGAFSAIQGVENRVGDLEHAESNLQDRMIAVEDKTAELERDIEACGDFELVKSDTLTEKVGVIQLDFPNQYKELYVRLKMPESTEAEAGTPSSTKARWNIETQNDTTTAIKKCIYSMGNQFITDYTENWFTSIHIKVIGNYCRTELWHNTETSAANAYAKYIETSTYSGTVAPSVPLPRGYIDKLKISFMSSAGVVNTNLRYLPSGTTYEVWGVRK